MKTNLIEVEDVLLIAVYFGSLHLENSLIARHKLTDYDEVLLITKYMFIFFLQQE